MPLGVVTTSRSTAGAGSESSAFLFTQLCTAVARLKSGRFKSDKELLALVDEEKDEIYFESS